MAQAGYTPIALYYSTTASAAPTAGNLVNGELAINISDKKLYAKDNGGNVFVIADASSGGTTATNLAGGSAGSVPYQSGANATTFLSIGTAAQVLQVNAGATAPEWVSSTGTGNVVRATSPTITTPTIATSATVPLLIGGTGTTSTLTLRSTSGVGTTGADIIFQTGNNGATEAARILNNGRVGINTTAPQALFHVSVDGNGALFSRDGAAAVVARSAFDTNADGAFFIGQRARTSIASPSIVNSGDRTIEIWGRGYDGAAYQSAGRITIDVDAAPGAGSMPGRMVFYTTPSASTTPAERMRIDSSGNVLVGATAQVVSERANITGATNTSSSGVYPCTIVLMDTNAYNSTNPSPGGGISFGYRYNAANAATLGPSIQGFKENTTDGDFAAGMKFFTRANGVPPVERMRIDSAGNVGIGTNNPTSALTIGTAGSLPILLNGATTNGSYIKITNTGGDYVGGLNNSSANLISGGLAYASFVGSNNATALHLLTSGGVRVTVDTTGNIGVGTNAPTNSLSFGGNTNRTIWMERNTTADTAGNTLILQAGGATSGATDKNGGTLRLSSGTSTGTGTSAITFFTSVAGAAGTGDNTLAERMRVTTTGKLAIGTTTARSNCQLTIDGINDATSTISLYRSDLAHQTIVGANYIGTFTATTFAIYTNSLERLAITNAGNVAIGTNSPANSGLQVSRNSTGGNLNQYPSVLARNESTTLGDGATTFNFGILWAQANNGGVAALLGARYDSLFEGGYTGTNTNHPFRIVTNNSERMRIDTSGNVLVTGIGGLGYGTGSGGAVTQTTSRTTGVTLDKTNGAITLVSAAGTTAWTSFTVTNSTVAATDVVEVCQKSGTNKYLIHVTNVAAGSFEITFATTGGTTTEQPVFNFAITKAVTS